MNGHRIVRWIIGVALACVVLWFMPLVRLSSLDRSASAKNPGDFDSVAIAKQLWKERLVPSFERAHDAATVLNAIETDPGTARKAYGRTIGVSRGFMVYLRGSGTILPIEQKRIAVALGDKSQADILLETGPIFGNAVRDGAGLIDTNDVANSQEFNRISADLNRLVEEQVQPTLKSGATPGKSIQFVGCAEVKDPERFARPLKVVPVLIEIE